MQNSPSNQVDDLKIRLNQFLETLDTIEPETADLEEIDRLISLVDDLEVRMGKLK
ncbi:hypothetical protein H9659_09860 [Sporosarcina sp. Sa3CUA8]|uniref:Uncharacterized protein n=2 Tax=Sporosarcina gallistercoris TaxID=2762245 RepID=A0ABR8PKD1_9BACL|nr:SE1561 family protein [Sporosarcina gallistercoris]MBD7908633.1 hypothetical protein [Sporosarcina gallistercoris]